MKPYKTTLKFKQVECLKQAIDSLLETEPDTDDDKLLFAVLAEIKGRLYDKLKNHFNECTMSFKAHEAFALRILFNDYLMDFTTYIGAKLLVMSNEIHEHFNH
jgi:hypothetical protein